VGARVVIAEDEALIRLDLRETLEEEGYQVVAETSRGDEVVELVRQHRPDLAILDIKMPGGDGLTAAAEITADRLAAVLILTAFSQRELVDRAREAGRLGLPREAVPAQRPRPGHGAGPRAASRR
jgi:DNA-binding NarL/FixJ family response regulator